MTADHFTSNARVWQGETPARHALRTEAAADFRRWAVEERIRGEDVLADDLERLAAEVDAYVLTCAALACGGGF